MNRDKSELQQKLIDVEVEKNNLIRNEKLLEERLKYMQEDKDKTEKNLIDKWKEKLIDKDDQLIIMENKLRALET